MSDTLLEVAVANWAARFTANGVDASDYARVTRSISQWSEWCRAWSEEADGHRTLGREAREAGHSRTAGEALARAGTYFHFAQFLFDASPAERRDAHDQAVACLIEASGLLDPPGTRVSIPFEAAELVGLLRLPAGAGPHPVVVLVPGLDSTKEEFREVERSFLERDMGTFALDGPGQGEAEHLGIRANWEVVMAGVLNQLREQAGVDPERIGLWGVSLGGYYAARAASTGRALGLRACVSLSGPYDFSTSFDELNPLTRGAFVARSLSANESEARRAAGELSLFGRAEAIDIPLLVVAGQQDRLISWREGARLAEEAPGSEFILIPDGSHGCTNRVYRHRPQAADWMGAHLGLEREAHPNHATKEYQWPR